MTNQAGETPELDEVELGARIHTLMWRRKLTQADLGRALGVLQPTAGKKIRGEVKISAIELLKIANWLDVSPNQLLAPLAPEGRLPQARPRPEIINDDMSWYRTPAERWNLPEDPNSDTHGYLPFPAEVVDLAAYRAGRACACPGSPVHHPSCPARRSA